MRVINYGERFEIYGDDLKTFDLLPAATYKVIFNMMSGFSLLKINDFETKEEKIYGNHKQKIDKVLKSYDTFNRSLGIILSGEKGMGKSLFTQLLAEEAIAKGLPVIMVQEGFKGIADFLDQIDQECLVIFDEFEKMFGSDNRHSSNSNTAPIESQDSLLGLFDGTSQKKRIYAITVNKLHYLSEFMVNRPGRFHYHIRFDYPDATEMEIYLKDKIETRYHEEIKQIVSFANKVKLNYDSLRSIAFEINQGYSFRDAIGDLNILSVESQRYEITIEFSNGTTEIIKNQALNLFNTICKVNNYMSNGDWYAIEFNPQSLVPTATKMEMSGNSVKLDVNDENDILVEGTTVSHLSVKLEKSANLHYTV